MESVFAGFDRLFKPVLRDQIEQEVINLFNSKSAIEQYFLFSDFVALAKTEELLTILKIEEKNKKGELNEKSNLHRRASDSCVSATQDVSMAVSESNRERKNEDNRIASLWLDGKIKEDF